MYFDKSRKKSGNKNCTMEKQINARKRLSIWNNPPPSYPVLLTCAHHQYRSYSQLNSVCPILPIHVRQGDPWDCIKSCLSWIPVAKNYWNTAHNLICINQRIISLTLFRINCLFPASIENIDYSNLLFLVRDIKVTSCVIKYVQ